MGLDDVMALASPAEASSKVFSGGAAPEDGFKGGFIGEDGDGIAFISSIAGGGGDEGGGDGGAIWWISPAISGDFLPDVTAVDGAGGTALLGAAGTISSLGGNTF